MAGLDLRRVQVGIEINGQLKIFSDPLAITSTGQKFTNALQNEAEISVSNLTKSDTDYLLTACSPFNKDRTEKLITLSAGRVSTGVSQIFKGNIVSCKPSQPPDIKLTFKCQTGAFQKGNIVSQAQGPTSSLSDIAGQVSSDTGFELNFEATDKTISNYSFTGGALKQVQKLGDVGSVNAYIDDDQLVVKDAGVPLKGVSRKLDLNSGMVGIPEVTERGIKVTYLLDNASKCGGGLILVSEVYAALSGNYHIYKLGWNITTRDIPFYWIAECERLGDNGQVIRPNPTPKKRKKK